MASGKSHETNSSYCKCPVYLIADTESRNSSNYAKQSAQITEMYAQLNQRTRSAVSVTYDSPKRDQ